MTAWVWLHDVLSLYPLGIEGVESNVLLGPDQLALLACSAPHRSTVRNVSMTLLHLAS